MIKRGAGKVQRATFNNKIVKTTSPKVDSIMMFTVSPPAHQNGASFLSMKRRKTTFKDQLLMKNRRQLILTDSRFKNRNMDLGRKVKILVGTQLNIFF